MAVNPFFLKLGESLADSVSIEETLQSLAALLKTYALANRVELALLFSGRAGLSFFGVDEGASPLATDKTISRLVSDSEGGGILEEQIADGSLLIHWAIPSRGGSSGCLSVVLDPTAPERAQIHDMLATAASFLRRSLSVLSPLKHENDELVDENFHLREEIRTRYRPEGFIWLSGQMEEIFQTAMRVAASNATVLIRGETGTGKEMLANMIHYHSSRANKPFIKVNCAALTETLLESELFGHAKGAFTGAQADRKGRFEAAAGGTIFLDEIGDISPRLQISLLRVLQEREITRVGDNLSRPVDVRIIAATHRNLEEKVADGSFRADLYYRLNVVYLPIPPLRERREDILPIVEYFLNRYNQQNYKRVSIQDGEVLRVLETYDWPGNVRELQNAVEKAVVLAPGEYLTIDLLPSSIVAMRPMSAALIAGSPEGDGGGIPELEDMVSAYLDSHYLERDLPHGAVFASVVSRVERLVIEKALRESGGCQLKASRALGINRNTIRKKIADYGIDMASLPRSGRS